MRLFKKIRKAVKGAVRRMKSKFDALGSYTGSPEKENSGEDKPEQDADDL